MTWYQINTLSATIPKFDAEEKREGGEVHLFDLMKPKKK